MFLSEFRGNHYVDNVVFLVDGDSWLQAACHRHGLRFQHITHGNRNAVERTFVEIKQPTTNSQIRSAMLGRVPLKLIASVQIRIESAYLILPGIGPVIICE